MDVNMNHDNCISNVFLQKNPQNQTRLSFNILNDNYPSLAVEPENSTSFSGYNQYECRDRNRLSESSCTIQCCVLRVVQIHE